MKKEAQWWRVLESDLIQCELCPHYCKLRDGKVGLCGVRKNSGGKLYSLTYEETTAVSMDPIEKKPLYHFFPGQQILSLGGKGCNLSCAFCQNWHISQNPDFSSRKISSDEAVLIAYQNNSFGIAYTFSEPLIWWEYIYDTAECAHRNGLKNVLVTNGYINSEPLRELLPYIDALNIDVKSFDPLFYRKVCGGRLEPVLAACEEAKKQSHVEISHLVVPFKNEEEILSDIKLMVDWISASLGQDTPLHFSRYFPNFKYDKPATSPLLLAKARDIALKKLSYVYLSSVQHGDGNNTYCPHCRELLVSRVGYHARVKNIERDQCTACGRKSDLVSFARIEV